MTYGEVIQNQIQALQEMYDLMNALRDLATEGEKEIFNSVRRRLPYVWEPLQDLDNALSNSRRAMEIKGGKR